VVRVSAYETTDPGSILGVATFLGIAVADSKSCKSHGDCSSAIKMPVAKSS